MPSATVVGSRELGRRFPQPLISGGSHEQRKQYEQQQERESEEHHILCCLIVGEHLRGGFTREVTEEQLASTGEDPANLDDWIKHLKDTTNE